MTPGGRALSTVAPWPCRRRPAVYRHRALKPLLLPFLVAHGTSLGRIGQLGERNLTAHELDQLGASVFVQLLLDPFQFDPQDRMALRVEVLEALGYEGPVPSVSTILAILLSPSPAHVTEPITLSLSLAREVRIRRSAQRLGLAYF